MVGRILTTQPLPSDGTRCLGGNCSDAAGQIVVDCRARVWAVGTQRGEAAARAGVWAVSTRAGRHVGLARRCSSWAAAPGYRNPLDGKRVPLQGAQAYAVHWKPCTHLGFKCTHSQGVLLVGSRVTHERGSVDRLVEFRARSAVSHAGLDAPPAWAGTWWLRHGSGP